VLADIIKIYYWLKEKKKAFLKITLVWATFQHVKRESSLQYCQQLEKTNATDWSPLCSNISSLPSTFLGKVPNNGNNVFASHEMSKGRFLVCSPFFFNLKLLFYCFYVDLHVYTLFGPPPHPLHPLPPPPLGRTCSTL
jgi:hypothetical protein